MDTSLAPGLLLAAPALGDPNFEHSVVLLGHHDDDGAVGWVLNGPVLASTPELLRGAGLIAPGAAVAPSSPLAAPARLGGPVMPGSAWLLFESAPGSEPLGSQIELGARYAITGAREAIEAIARGDGPERFRLLLGYAGWAPGQLEGEIQQGAWLPAPLDVELLLAVEIDSIWDRAYQRAVGSAPGRFSPGGRGSS